MRSAPSSARRVPAVVISGFLGSGKTTLVRRLLDDARDSGVRLAVISNEFGELGIDRSLFAAAGDDALVELAGGCVCCQLSNDLLDTLQRLREEIDPDRIVIETSGVALPSETSLNFYRDPVRSWIGDDIGVVVVNAEQVAEGRDLTGTFEDQVSSADMIVLNKVDLVAAAELPAIEARIRDIEPEAPILHAEHADVDPRLLFVPRSERRGSTPPERQPHSHEHFDADEIRFPDDSSREDVQQRLAAMAPLRSKGFVHTAAGLLLVQGVGRRIQLEAVDYPIPDDMRGRVVIIRRRAHS